MKKSIAIIMYYDWSSDGRCKAARDIYHKLGYNVFVFSTKEAKTEKKPNQEVFHGVKKYQGESIFLFLFSHLMFMVQASFWLIRICIYQKIELIHIRNMPDYLMLISIIGKIFGKKVLWDMQDVTPAVWFSKKNDEKLNPYGFSYLLMAKIQKLCGLLSNNIICADKMQKEYLIQNGLNKNKIHIFMNLPLISVFNWIGPQYNNGIFRLVYHGSISRRLGLDLAIKAIDRVKNEIPNIKFDIIGSGEFSAELEMLIKELQLETFVTFSPSFIAIEDIPDWLNGASGAIIPNRKTYATDNFMLSMKMLEYIKLGIPLIIPKLKIITSYIYDSEAIFYEPNNIEDIVNSIRLLYKADRNKLAANALNFFQRHKYTDNESVIANILTK